MSNKEYFLIGFHHIDLAWKRSREEMEEMLEVFIIRLLDTLDSNPDYKHVIEQASHFRNLIKRRPDLVERLKPYIKSGRIEFVGGMASTLENNIPNGESFVKNQAIGMKWVKDNLDADIKTGWLIDTFGVNAQVPQILNQFGIKDLMANRFGGRKYHDVFVSKGLDGSEVLIVGREVYSAYIRPEFTSIDFYTDWDGIERCFVNADKLEGEGPFLLGPHTENERLLSLRAVQCIEQRNRDRKGELWKFGLPFEYFEALRKKNHQLPVENGDLNPEFTGTFSLRTIIRIRNRRVENLLLEAEKWAALLELKGWEKDIENAWWDMAFNQFHDVFTGSHPTAVFRRVMELFDSIEKTAQKILDSAFRALLTQRQPENKKITLSAFNGLPWLRKDIITFKLTKELKGVSRITCEDRELPFEVKEGKLRILTEIPAMSGKSLVIEKGDATKIEKIETDSAIIENEYILIECDNKYGVKRMVWKETNKTLIENAGDILVVQQDNGNFQIELPDAAEVAAEAGKIKIYSYASSDIGESILISGVFPELSWAGENNALTWEAELTLLKGKPRVDFKLKLHWKGERSRIRLKLSTTLNTSEGIYEIPFGTVHRRPYGVTGTARGEWPAHRFVAMEDNLHGMALINTGTAGVEVSGGTMLNTLIRAPKSVYSGMISDDTSSQHGDHQYDFAIVPYSGSWENSAVIESAQEINNPIHAIITKGIQRLEEKDNSFIKLSNSNVVLSAVKAADDGMGELVVRIYETAGIETSVQMFVKDSEKVWNSNLKEDKFETLICEDENIKFAIKAFEIKTLRIKRR
jgi:alpha-mannosidase